MKRVFTFLALLLTIAAVADASTTRRINETFDHEPGQRVKIDFPVGELRVEAGDVDRVQVELEAECRRDRRDCRRILDKLTVESRSSARRLLVEFEGYSKWRGGANLEIDTVVTVPRAAVLDIDMGVGELRLDGFENDVTVDLGIGEARLRLPEARVGSVNLDAGIGEARLSGASDRVRSRRSLLVGAEVKWNDGPGASRVKVDLGIGEIHLRLEE